MFGSGIKNISNKELAEQMQSSVIRKSDKGKKHLPFSYLLDLGCRSSR